MNVFDMVKSCVAITMLVLVMALGYNLYTASGKVSKLQAEVSDLRIALAASETARSSETAALSTRLRLAEKARKQKEVRDVSTTKALADNPDWAGQRVPDAVIDALGM